MTIMLFQVMSVIKRHPSAQKISFIGHSLGGLVTRYAIARLYERDINQEVSHGNAVSENDGYENSCEKEKFKAKIAGLEPMNFITSATPHLGSRGHRQVTCFCAFIDLLKNEFFCICYKYHILALLTVKP